MRTLKTMPRCFDSLHTLNVWTHYGSLMVQCHEVLNGHRCPYANADVWTTRGGNTPYTNEEILDSLRSRGATSLKFNVNPHRRMSLTLNAPVVSATPVVDSATAWVLLLEGMLIRHSYDKEPEQEKLRTPVKIALYYDTEFGQGFCLLSERACALLGCERG